LPAQRCWHAVWRRRDQRARLSARQCSDEQPESLRADQQKVGIETILHYTCRDRNVLSIQSDLLGAASIGLKNILCLTGDPPKMGNYPDATAVFDVDAIGSDEHRPRIEPGSRYRAQSDWRVNRVYDFGGGESRRGGYRHEVRRFAYKVAAGAEFCITQPVFDQKLLEDFLRRIEAFRIPVIAGIWPLTSVRNAEFMKNDLRVSMPDEIFTRMAAAPDKDAALAEGVDCAGDARERSRLRAGCAGECAVRQVRADH
jgi:hypothetical protein